MEPSNRLNFPPLQTDLKAMKLSGPATVDLVPLGERMRLLTVFRAFAVLVVLLVSALVPSASGVDYTLLVAVSASYVTLTLAAEFAWRRSGHRWRLLFSVLAMADSVYLAWVSYATAGLDSPLQYLVILQIITVALLASFRNGLKLALFNAWLLLFVVYAQEAGVLPQLGSAPLELGDNAYRQVFVASVVWLLVAAVTTAFAAVNERELRRRRFDLEKLAEFSMRLESHEGPEGKASCLLDGVAEVYDVSPSLVVRREADGMLRVLAAHGFTASDGDHDGARLARELSSPVIAQAMADDVTLLVGNAGRKDDTLLSRFADTANAVIIPLRGDHGVVVGALVAEHPVRRGTRIERRALDMIESFASHGSLAIENAYLLAEVKALAITDPLTGVANRRHLDSFLERSCAQVARGHGTLGLMMIDIDHFKRLNDTYGHQVGDEVLQAVAQTLDGDLRAGDLAARYGGEEFSVVMPGARGPEVHQAAERIRQAIAALDHEVAVTVSIGIAWAPHHGVTRDALTRAADAALYRAKEGGRNRIEAADPPLTSLESKAG